MIDVYLNKQVLYSTKKRQPFIQIIFKLTYRKYAASFSTLYTVTCVHFDYISIGMKEMKFIGVEM